MTKQIVSSAIPDSVINLIKVILKKDFWYTMSVVPHFSVNEVGSNILLIRVDIGVVSSFVIGLAKLKVPRIELASSCLSNNNYQYHLTLLDQGSMVDLLDYRRGSSDSMADRLTDCINMYDGFQRATVKNECTSAHYFRSQEVTDPLFNFHNWFECGVRNIVSLMSGYSVSPARGQAQWVWPQSIEDFDRIKTFWPIKLSEKVKMVKEMQKLLPKPI